MTPSPPPLPVACLVDDDAVDPGAKGGLAAEPVNRAKDAQENFLREIEGFVMIAQQIQGQLVDQPLMFGGQLRAGVLVANRAALNQRRLAPADLGPGNGWNRLH